MKSTHAEIAARFDADVARFSNLETGQVTTLDAPLAMELITQAAITTTPEIRAVLDIGCGAGNNTLKLLRTYGRAFDCHLLDLSANMLAAARERLEAEKAGAIVTLHTAVQDAVLGENRYDVVIAAASLHHLRDDAEWETAFRKIFRALRPGGSFWITDLVTHESPALHAKMWSRYGDYLTGVGGAEFAEKVFAYIDKEDTPRPVTYQLDLMRRVGFRTTDILHKNSCFAAFGAVK